MTLDFCKFKRTVIRDLLKIQGSNGNWNYDEYMWGLYNGMELALATMETREPEFRSTPKDGFIKDKIPKDFVPEIVSYDYNFIPDNKEPSLDAIENGNSVPKNAVILLSDNAVIWSDPHEGKVDLREIMKNSPIYQSEIHVTERQKKQIIENTKFIIDDIVDRATLGQSSYVIPVSLDELGIKGVRMTNYFFMVFLKDIFVDIDYSVKFCETKKYFEWTLKW